MDTSHDQKSLHCRRLGHEVPFAYCRQEQDGQRPCRLIRDCWWQVFDVETFLQQNLPAAEFELFQSGAGAPDKILGLFEMIEQARSRLQSSFTTLAPPDENNPDGNSTTSAVTGAQNVVDVICHLAENSALRPESLEALASGVVDGALSALQESPAEVSVLFVEDAEMAGLNEQYRHRQGPTDVLSFSLREGDGPVAPDMEHLLGDIVISVDTACRQASEACHSPRREIAVLLIHGLLHLLGHDHEQGDEAAQAMEDLQQKCLREITNQAPDLLV